ncbi:MAG: hypothetical protein WA208_04530 [Thermoanaerobaculia bacterium]
MRKADRYKPAIQRRRPKTEGEMVSRMVQIGLNADEIGRVMGRKTSTVEKMFAKELHRGLVELFLTARREQFRRAFSGDTLALIDLSVQILDEFKDKREEAEAILALAKAERAAEDEKPTN